MPGGSSSYKSEDSRHPKHHFPSDAPLCSQALHRRNHQCYTPFSRFHLVSLCLCRQCPLLTQIPGYDPVFQLAQDETSDHLQWFRFPATAHLQSFLFLAMALLQAFSFPATTHLQFLSFPTVNLLFLPNSHYLILPDTLLLLLLKYHLVTLLPEFHPVPFLVQPD